MNIINNNPYRILGLPLTASEREIHKQINTLTTYIEMGRTKSFDTDFSFLKPTCRTKQTIEDLKKQIEQSENKFLYSLFWFWNKNLTDEWAFEALREGNIDKAIAIWEKYIFITKNKIYLQIPIISNLIETSSNWSIEDNDTHVFKREQGTFSIERKNETGSSIPSVSIEFNFNQNWSIECDIQWLSGVDNSSYGIILGKENGSYLMFSIAANGYYQLGKNVDWVYSELIAWKQCELVNKHSTNHIKIQRSNDKLYFYINGYLVDSYEHQPLFGKYFGFKVSNKQKISFKNFKFCELVEDDTYGKGIEVNSNNFSNVKNLSILYLYLSIQNENFNIEHFRKGLLFVKAYLMSENLESYSKLIAGDRYILTLEKTLQFFVNEIIESIKKYFDISNGISTYEFISSFSLFPDKTKQIIINKFASKQIQNINKEIETSKDERLKTPENSIAIGKSLVMKTKKDISYLKSILKIEEFQFQMISDKLSREIVQCGVDAFNTCKNNLKEIDYPNAIKSEESYVNEYRYAFEIALTKQAKDRAKENLDSCLEYVKNKHFGIGV